MTERLCSNGCPEPVKGRDLCGRCYANLAHRLKAYGRWEPQFVDVAPVRERVAALRAAGIGFPRLQELTGLAGMTLEHICDDGRRSVSRSTWDAVMAVSVPTSPLDPRIADGARVASVGTTRRLRGLSWMGWSSREVTRFLGLNDKNGLSKLYSGQHTQVTAGRARAIADIFDRLALTLGPNLIARRMAIEKGWAPPLAWMNPDDPNEMPDPGVVQEVPTSELIAELQDMGITDVDQLGDRLGIKPKSVLRHMERLRQAERSAAEQVNAEEMQVA